MKPNMDLRYYAKGHGVSLWQIAEEEGVCEQTIINHLRKEFSEEDKADFKRKVDKIANTADAEKSWNKNYNKPIGE